jgi:hypothetical protein
MSDHESEKGSNKHVMHTFRNRTDSWANKEKRDDKGGSDNVGAVYGAGWLGGCGFHMGDP